MNIKTNAIIIFALFYILTRIINYICFIFQYYYGDILFMIFILIIAFCVYEPKTEESEKNEHKN